MMTRVCIDCIINNNNNKMIVPTAFVLDMIGGYVQSGAYSVTSMEEREVEIRKKAEDLVQSTLPLHKRIVYNWVLFHARRGTVTSSI